MIPRGGLTLKSGKIGRANVLRQTILAPGEIMNCRINGQVKLESLRERDSMRINAHLATFMTPIRWLWPEFPDFIKEGPKTSITPPLVSDTDFSAAGIGANSEGAENITCQRFWLDSCLRIHNEWYKHPEDPDVTSLPTDGNVAVPLQHTWSRMRYTAEPTDSSDYLVQTLDDTMDVRDLAKIQGQFKAAMDRDVMSYNRYLELIKDMFNADGSREVDQVPIMIDQQEVGVNPRDMPATDAAGLGEWTSMFDFYVDHEMKGIAAPEHAIITHILTIRFAPIIEMRHPMASDQLDWATQVMSTDILDVSPPVPVTRQEFDISNSTTPMGYHPSGWQWRSPHDVIGKRIDSRDSFPYMRNPTTPQQCKDATRIKNAFRSQSLGDYVADLYFHENVKSPLGTAKESFFSGLAGSGDQSTHPAQGKML